MLLASRKPCTVHAKAPASVQRVRSTHYVRPRRQQHVTTAGLKEALDFVASGFMKIFSPPSDAGVNWKGTSTGFSGDIPRRDSRRRNSEPVAPQQTMMAEEQAEEQGSVHPAAEYIEGALERVIGHNFKGDEHEPEWKGTGTGWTGDTRKRGQEGFHSKKL